MAAPGTLTHVLEAAQVVAGADQDHKAAAAAAAIAAVTPVNATGGQQPGA